MRTFCWIVTLLLLCLWLASCAPESEAPRVTDTSTRGSVTLAWTPGDVTDISVTDYIVHYGTTSPQESGSCDYDHARMVPSTQTDAVLTGLAPSVRYYLTVSAYNGLESRCSEEISYIYH